MRGSVGGYFAGDEYSNPGGYLRGSIKELMVFYGKKAHEIDRYERYLANKWGIEIDGPIDELNNEEFSIDGDGVVKTKIALDFEEDANRTIRIRATDPYGEFIEKELVVSSNQCGGGYRWGWYRGCHR